MSHKSTSSKTTEGSMPGMVLQNETAGMQAETPRLDHLDSMPASTSLPPPGRSDPQQGSGDRALMKQPLSSLDLPALPSTVCAGVDATPLSTEARSHIVSLQSVSLTPPRSGLETPRSAMLGGPQLAKFSSIASVPLSQTSLDNMEQQTAVYHHFPPETVVETNDQDGEIIVVEAEDRVARRKKGGHRVEMDANEHSMEFTSFNMDVSFVSGASLSTSATGPRVYSSLSGGAFHIFKGNVGAGVFLLPTYYQDSGYVLGVIMMCLLSALMVDCALTLLHAKHTINHAEIKTYPAVVGFVLGDWVLQFTKFSLIFTQFGFCIMFLQYASSSFANMVNNQHLYGLFVLLCTIVVTPMTFISNKMHLLVYASMAAGVMVALVICGTTMKDFTTLASSGVAPGVAAFIPTARIIVFLSGHMFSLEGIGIVLPVENSLAPQDRQKFASVMKVTLVTIAVLYIFFGVLGYLAYGETLQTSVVFALPPGFMRVALQILLGVSLIFGFPIQYVPAIQLIDKSLGINLNDDNKTKAYLVRVALNASFGLLAFFIGGDYLNVFASFLGAFAGVHLMVTIPAFLGLLLDHALTGEMENMSYSSYLMLLFRGPYTLKRCRFYVYLVFAVIIWVGGLYFTVESIF